MFPQGISASLTEDEKRIVKGLCNENWTNQDIQALINLERKPTINSGRITPIKKDPNQQADSTTEISEYQEFKRSFDLKTGLNPFHDERLIKSREAMKIAIGTFNNPTLHFRTEAFSMLANVAWTYIAIEYSARNEMPTHRKNGSAISLADFLKHELCPFSKGVTNNLNALIKIRNASEHTVLGPLDDQWASIFQANCINYEREITTLFGPRLSLSPEINFALQLSGLSIGQAIMMKDAKLPEKISAINSEIFGKLSDNEKNDQEFQFSVVYTTVETSKSKAAFQFVSPKSAEGLAIANVLVKHKPSAITHPHKVTEVAKRVRKDSGKPFTTHDHTLMWKEHKVRPPGGSINPEKTNLDYCYYNPTFKAYTYNEAWVEFIVNNLEKP